MNTEYKIRVIANITLTSEVDAPDTLFAFDSLQEEQHVSVSHHELQGQYEVHLRRDNHEPPVVAGHIVSLDNLYSLSHRNEIKTHDRDPGMGRTYLVDAVKDIIEKQLKDAFFKLNKDTPPIVSVFIQE